jgi:outer membrane receptor protein involved in Fe transport
MKSRWIVIVLLLLAAIPAMAQTGGVTGTVKDQSGAVLPGVNITIVNTGTNAERTAVSDERGDYTVSLLPIGVYRIQAELPGFKKGIAENIKMNASDRLRIDFVLQVGAVNDQLIVSEAAPLVQSETSSVGKVIDSQKIGELPLNGRRFESLLGIVPGVTASGVERSVPGVGVISAGGARTTGNNFMMDGIDNNDNSVNDFTLRPIVDAIQEFKVMTNSYSAEYGRGAGANVHVSTKSGTNQIHGSAWEFLRNDALDARNFFASPLERKPTLRLNQYGATVGGPIKKDQTFFFFAYEGIRRKQQITSLQQVPSLAFRQGDFSALSLQLKDPVSQGTFANNQIPANRFDPIAVKILQRGSYPAPTPGLTGSNNLLVNNPIPQNVDQYSIRLDHRLTSNNTLFGRYGFTQDKQDVPCSGNGATRCLPGFGHTDTMRAHQASIADTHIFSSRFVNEFRLGFNRQLQPRVPLTSGVKDVSTELGIPVSDNPRDWGHPSINITGVGTIGDRGYQARWGTTFQLTDTFNYTAGRQSLRFGIDLRRAQFYAVSQPRETLRFDARWTGNAFADFLLGFSNQTTRDQLDAMRHHLVYGYHWFAQDDIKLSDKLTLNLGVRYEYYTPDVDNFDRLGHFNIKTGQYEIAGQNGASRALYNPDKNNFAPRVGFAYRPTGTASLVVRAGYGWFYNMAMLGNNLFFVRNGFPFAKPETFNATTNPADLSLSNPFPSALLGTPIYDAPSMDPDFRDGYVQQWNLGVEKEVAANTIVELGYLGSKGTRLTRRLDINQAFPGTAPLQQRRPYPQYATMNYLTGSASSIYHGLLSRIERRFSSGLTFLGSYTFGHAIDDDDETSSAQDVRNLRANRASSNFDIRHRLVASFVVELPYGRGKRWGNDSHPVINGILGGWELSGVQTFQTGRPINIGLSGTRSNTSSTRDKPNATGIDPILENSLDKKVYLNPAAFEVQPAGTFGNAGRNSVYGPGTNNIDMTLAKNFKFEGGHVQLRGDFFNALNRTFLDNPNVQRDNSAFGTITQTLRDNRQIQLGLRIVF